MIVVLTQIGLNFEANRIERGCKSSFLFKDKLMQYIQDAFGENVLKMGDLNNFPIMFRYLERNDSLVNDSRKLFYDKVDKSTEFNTTRLPLLPPDKPISKLI